MSAEEAAEYFRRRPFHRLLELIRQKLIERGGGNVVLANPAKEELAALRAFLGRPLRRRPDGAVVVALREVEAVLADPSRSRFECGLREAVEAYFGEPIVTRREQREQAAAEWEAFLARMRAVSPPELHEFVAGLRGEWRQHGPRLEEALRLVFQAVAELPRRRGELERLPVFANRLAGDPHALDGDRLEGRLFLRALAEILPIAAAGPEGDSHSLATEGDARRRGPEGDAQWRSLLLAAAGLGRDDLSSTVLAVGLMGEDPVLEAARRAGAALAYPLRTVQGWRRVSAAGGVAYVVENPAVFSAFLDGWRESGIPPASWPTVICSSGQLSAAAVGLLDLLVQGGAAIRYSGDFDVGGLRIARGLIRHYGPAVRLWRMDPGSYRLAVRTGGRPWKEGEAAALAGLEADFPDLVPAMLAEGRAAYQEAIAAELLGDLAADMAL